MKTIPNKSNLLWFIAGSLIFSVLFVADMILTTQKLQLWIGDYHIHHSLLGVILIVMGSITVVYKWKKREPLPRTAILVLFFGILIIVEWGLLHYTECGERYLLITKNE